MNYSIVTNVDEEFGHYMGTPHPVPGVKGFTTKQISLSSGITMHSRSVIVDEQALMGQPFWRPIELLTKIEKRIDELTDDEFHKAFAPLRGERDDDLIVFDDLNDHDVNKIFRDKDRIGISFKESHLSSVYAIQLEDSVQINLTPSTKSYYQLEESEWVKFLGLLTKDLQDRREDALNDLLSERPTWSNLMRRIRYRISIGAQNSFECSVYDFYKSKGYITEKQANALMSGRIRR